MSVYSGFATRNQETYYNKLVEKAMTLMNQKIVCTYKGKLVPDEKAWAKKMMKLHKAMVYMEQNKYLEP